MSTQAAAAPVRVVTGHDEKGNSIFVPIDQPVPGKIHPASPNSITRIWSTLETPADNQANPEQIKTNIPSRFGTVQPNGSHCSVVDMAPGSASPMHRTNSLDYMILISGKLSLVLEDGSYQDFSEPGSICVQRGAMHKWVNNGPEWVRFACVVLDAKPVEIKDAEGKVTLTVDEFRRP